MDKGIWSALSVVLIIIVSYIFYTKPEERKSHSYSSPIVATNAPPVASNSK
jgi:hypothetical protein